MRLLEARAGLELGLPDRCQPILRDDYELVDIREGESSLTDLWFELRMKAGANGNGRLMDCDSSKDDESHHPCPSRLDFQVMPDPRCSAFARQEIRRPEAPSKIGWQ